MLKICLNHFSLLLGLTAALHWQTVFSESRLNLVYCPDSLHFSESEPLKSSSLADFLSLALGYSLPKPLEWKGLTAITDVFSLARATLTLTINGQIHINSIHKFPILETRNLDNEFEILSQRTQQKFAENNRIVLKINSYEKDQYFNHMSGKQLAIPGLTDSLEQRLSIALESNDLKSFVQNNEVDKSDPNINGLVLEIAAIRQTLKSLKKLKASDNKFLSIRTILWFDIKSFGHIIKDKIYDQSVKDGAQKLILNLVEELKHDLRDIYNNRLVFTVIEDQSMAPPLLRQKRALVDDQNNATLNLGHNFDTNFHTAFAMIAFTTILIAISVFGISVSMWNLDPGKDSIIYRMTSQRIKKDQ